MYTEKCSIFFFLVLELNLTLVTLSSRSTYKYRLQKPRDSGDIFNTTTKKVRDHRLYITRNVCDKKKKMSYEGCPENKERLRAMLSADPTPSRLLVRQSAPLIASV